MVVLKECNNMFWGVAIDSGKRYSTVVEKAFHLSMAALECDPDGKKQGHVQLMLKHQTADHLLCTLGPGQHLQQQLDLTFSTGEEITFYLNGIGVVHLTGTLMEDEDFPDDFDDEDYDSESSAPQLVSMDDSDDEEDSDWTPVEAGAKRKAVAAIGRSGKKAKITELNEDVEDEDDEYDSSFIDDEAMGEEEEEEEDEDDDEDDGESDSMMEELQPASKPVKSPKKLKQLDTSNGATPASQKKKTPKAKDKKPTEQAKMGSTTPGAAGDADTSEKKKKKKKKKKKNKDTQEESTSPQQQTSTEKHIESPTTTPTAAVGKKRTFAGGTAVEDSKIGHGPEAKPGKMVSVYYVGTLAKNNKRFDSCQKGKPLRFRLGRGEVIKGWDTGLLGMKVGGKRRITVPPSQGYGNSRQGPIPPGSTLVFDVELKAVS